jgi:hypothetical protein
MQRNHCGRTRHNIWDFLVGFVRCCWLAHLLEQTKWSIPLVGAIDSILNIAKPNEQANKRSLNFTCGEKIGVKGCFSQTSLNSVALYAKSELSFLTHPSDPTLNNRPSLFIQFMPVWMPQRVNVLGDEKNWVAQAGDQSEQLGRWNLGW